MAKRNRKRSQGNHGSPVGMLEKVADVGASVHASPVETWHTAREGTQQLAKVLPESMGMGSVKHFIQRHPVASTCAALVLGYMVFGASLPLVGGVARIVRGRV